jgi:exosortase H (IPTLxxWG-CTERM-specific)
MDQSLLEPVNRQTAWSLWGALRLVGLDPVVRGAVVSAGGFAVSIIPECTVLFAAGLFGCFVAAYPATLRHKVTGLFLGIPVLYLINLVRLQAVFLVGWIDRGLFDFLHVYLGQILTVSCVFLACWIWLRSLTSTEEPGERVREIAAFWLRFFIVSAALFLVWIKVNRGYVGFIDQVMVWGFELAGRTIRVSRDQGLYYPTFSIVTFVSLVVSARSLDVRRRMRGLAAGLAILFVLHLAHRICNVFLVAYGMPSFDHWAVAIRTVGQYLLPVLFWVVWVKPGAKAAAVPP